jgi:dolichyl-phosphate-mannose--protein O-mannosyl transferase
MVKSNRLILAMQIVTILPVIIFLAIYSSGGTLFLILLPLFALGYNIYNYIRGLTLVRYPLLIILFTIFLVYAIYGLGSRDAPQSFENYKIHENVTTFEFSKESKIDKVCYYIGIDKNVKFNFRYLGENSWHPLYKYDKNFPFSFRWNCFDVNVKTKEIRLDVTKGKMMLGEIRFLKNDIPIEFESNREKLNDEANATIDKTFIGGMFFDEIYHGRTAYEILHDIPVYETTHPYLGKIIISMGIKAFGMTPFGWRIANVIFGALFIFVAYYFAMMLFKEESLGFASAVIMLYSFMHFTQARAGFIDTFGVLFVFISYYFLYRFIIHQKLSWLLISGVFFGLAGAIKWSALFASLGFLAIAIYLLLSSYPLQKRFAGYRLILYGILSYIVIATVVYTLTFWDIYAKTGSFEKIIDYQINMYKYHTALVATHSYSSPWWSWIIDMKPMNYYREIKDGLFSSITCFGNPAIFWTGVVALLYISYVAIRKRSIEAIFILFAFLGLYLPYIFVSRLMFIYHFYYAVPFLILAIIYSLGDLLKWNSKGYIIYFLYLISVITLFLMFYPVLSGHEIAKTFVDNYLVWFSGWWI